MQRKVNSAKSLYSLSEHGSMYIPLSFPTSLSSSLPKSICRKVFDRESLWHTSALLATVMESISLPSRLHQLGGTGSGSRAGLLNNLEAVLNGNGNQKVSSAQMSIVDPATLQMQEEKEISSLGARGGKSDDRMRMQGRSIKESDHSVNNSHAAKLNIDFLPHWSDDLLPRASHPDRGHSGCQHYCCDHEKSREHIFGQVETLRGLGMSGTDGIGGHEEAREALFDNRTNRMQRRLAALPILEKYVLFLTVFPHLPLLIPVPLSVCIWPGVYVSVLRAVHRASGMAYACTLTHPKYPLLGFPPGRGTSLATEWIGKNGQIAHCSCHSMHASVSALPHTYFSSLHLLRAQHILPLETHTPNPSTHIISSKDTLPPSSFHCCPLSLRRFSFLRQTIITTSPSIPPYPPPRSFPPRSKVWEKDLLVE